MTKNEFNEEKIDEILEWMNSHSDITDRHKWTKESLMVELESSFDRKRRKWSTGGFNFIKRKDGIYIGTKSKGKIIYKNTWLKGRYKKREPNEIQENNVNCYKCVKCELEGRTNKPDTLSWRFGFFNPTIYVSNGDVCNVCGYRRPTDKEIIELWNKGIELKEMCKLLDESNVTYIKTRLKKYGLYERVAWHQHNAFDNDLIYSAYVWERVNQDEFPLDLDGVK